MEQGSATPEPKRRMTRRRFLAASGGTAAMLALPALGAAAASASDRAMGVLVDVGAGAGLDLETAAASRLPTVAFTWDGPWQSMYRNGLPLFAARGFRATAFVISGKIAGSYPFVNRDPICTWDQVSGLRSAGWEISNHTYDHKNLTSLKAAEIRAEIQGGKEVLVDRGYATPGFAYPYNLYDDQVQNLTEIYHEYARAGSVGDHGLGPLTSLKVLYALPSVNIAHRVAADMVARTQVECIDGGLDLIWLCHCCGDVGWDGPGQMLTVDPKELAGYLDWLVGRKADGKLAVTTCRVLVRGNLLATT